MSSSEGDTTLWYDARVARVGGRLLVDISPTDSSELGFYRDGLTYGMHSLFLIEFEQDRVGLRTWKTDSLEHALRRGRIPLPYTMVGGDIVVGGSTDQLWRAARTLVTSHFPVDTSGDVYLYRPAGQ